MKRRVLFVCTHNAARSQMVEGSMNARYGMKLVRAFGTGPHLHIVAPACGIAKRGMDDPQYAEIECLAAAVRAAIGRHSA